MLAKWTNQAQHMCAGTTSWTSSYANAGYYWELTEESGVSHAWQIPEGEFNIWNQNMAEELGTTISTCHT
jgi:hypothetical protein